MLQLVLGSVAGAIAGVLMWRWLSTGAYRTAQDSPTHSLKLTWLLIPTAAGAGGLAGACLGWLALPAWVYLVGGVLLSWVDLDVHRVPDSVLVRWAPLVAAAVLTAAAGSRDWSLLPQAAAGAGSMAAVFLLLVMLGSMGLGDLKLAAVTGLLTGSLGVTGWVTALAAGLATGAVAGLVLLARGRSRTTHLAFAPAIVIGAAMAVLRVSLGI